MTNLLVPTDFSAESLQLAEQALQITKNQKVNIILFHAFELPSSPHDLVGNNSAKPYASLMDDGFRLACRQLKDRYSRAVQKIQLKYMQGSSVALFRNFADANDIDLIVCPEQYVFIKVHERSINPVPLFRKSGIPFLRELQAPVVERHYNIPETLLQGGLATS